MKKIKAVMMMFVVSWITGKTYEQTPCSGKEPEGIICAHLVDQKQSREFKTEEAATEFLNVLKDMKAQSPELVKTSK